MNRRESKGVNKIAYVNARATFVFYEEGNFKSDEKWEYKNGLFMKLCEK